MLFPNNSVDSIWMIERLLTVEPQTQEGISRPMFSMGVWQDCPQILQRYTNMLQELFAASI